MKKKLLSNLFLLFAILGGVNSAWADGYYTPTADEVIILNDVYNASATSAGYSSHSAVTWGGTASTNNKKAGDPNNGGAATATTVTCFDIKGNGGGKNITLTITGVSKLTLYHESHTSRYPRLNITCSDNTTENKDGSTGVYYNEYSLDASKSYSILLQGIESSKTADLYVYAIKLTKPAAGVPTINTQPVSAQYEVGETATALTVAATASAGTLSYQWYKNTTASTEGATAIANATSASYTPDASTIGVNYYYCHVTDGNGSIDTDFVTVTVTGASMPTISYASNTVTITKSGEGDIFYTLDNSEPTTSSTSYSNPFTIDNTCTVRAIKVRNGNSSEIAFKNCYVDHSATALAVLGMSNGTGSGSTWTSTDGEYTLTDANNNINYYTIFTNSDAFKLNANDHYTLKVSDDVKVTSIKVVGISRADAVNATTLSFTDFTPASATFEMGTFVKTVEYTPTSDLGYGASIEFTPSGNQFGAWIEIYGVKRNGPAEAVVSKAATWDFSSADAQSVAGTVSSNSGTVNVLKATDGSTTLTYVSGKSDGYDSSGNGGYLKANGATPSDWSTRFFLLQIASDGTLSIATAGNEGEYNIYQGATPSFSDAQSTLTLTTETPKTLVSKNLKVSDGKYVFVGFTGGKRYTQKITWIPTDETITLTTTANMAGWRSFYDASQSYTVDANTKVYVATNVANDVVTLTAIDGGIPAATPVILKTTADDRAMTLAEGTVAAYTGGNELKATTAGQNLSTGVYRLGYGDEGVGFYTYTTASAQAGIVYIDKPSNGRTLRIAFADDATGVNTIENGERIMDHYFDLQGRRVAQPQKGLYIVNGKKVVVK